MSIKDRIRRLERQRKDDCNQVDGFVTVPYDLTPEEELEYLTAMGEDVNGTIYIDLMTGERIEYT